MKKDSIASGARLVVDDIAERAKGIAGDRRAAAKFSEFDKGGRFCPEKAEIGVVKRIRAATSAAKMTPRALDRPQMLHLSLTDSERFSVKNEFPRMHFALWTFNPHLVVASLGVESDGCIDLFTRQTAWLGQEG